MSERLLRFDADLSSVSVERFLGRRVRVRCCGGYVVEGVLVGCDPSQHGGVGSLVLRVADGRWVLVRCWTMICEALSG